MFNKIQIVKFFPCPLKKIYIYIYITLFTFYFVVSSEDHVGNFQKALRSLDDRQGRSLGSVDPSLWTGRRLQVQTTCQVTNGSTGSNGVPQLTAWPCSGAGGSSMIIPWFWDTPTIPAPGPSVYDGIENRHLKRKVLTGLFVL